jgi:hypothetical protein
VSGRNTKDRKKSPALFSRMASFHEHAGKNLDALGGVLRCRRCNREQPMAGAGDYLRTGWPECCGETMEWLTAQQLAGETT